VLTFWSSFAGSFSTVVRPIGVPSGKHNLYITRNMEKIMWKLSYGEKALKIGILECLSIRKYS
jgi:hypothetical protein